MRLYFASVDGVNKEFMLDSGKFDNKACFFIEFHMFNMHSSHFIFAIGKKTNVFELYA